MSKQTFDKIAEGLKEAIAIVRGEAKPAKLFVPPSLWRRLVRSYAGWRAAGFGRWQAAVNAWILR